MLKINLLPNRKSSVAPAPGADGGRTFAVALAATLALLVTGLFLFHSNQSAEVESARANNNTTENQIRSIRSRVSDHERVRRELAEIRSREEAIEHLESARTGPTSVLIEVSHLLSPGGRPATDPVTLDRIQRDNPSQMYSGTWDTRRIWLTKFAETERRVEIEGEGRTADDVGEFMRRMMLSQYFEQVRLERSEGALHGESTQGRTRLPVQRFKISARVRY